MDVRTSYNWLREYVETKFSPEEFARRVSLSGPSVERIERLAESFANMVVGRVEEVKKHPNADKLHLARVNFGSESRELVCGGTNLREGMLVAVATPGARVRWHGEGEFVALEEAEIRGVKSTGMICAANEIGLADIFPMGAAHEILDLSETRAKPGMPLARALGLDDAILSIEVTGNRPDAMSVVGLAREAAAILGAQFLWKEQKLPKVAGKYPEGYKHPAGYKYPSGYKTALSVRIATPGLCARYEAALVRGVEVRESPLWMKRRLASAGARSINSIVDITNYVMLELGQPMHAFDAQKLTGGIVVRKARAGEKIRALDGKTYVLAPDMLVIVDAEKPVAIAGVIGGEESAVGTETREVVFESAAFDPVSVRRTSRALGIQTDSSLRFEKGLSSEGTASALARAVELSGGELVAHIDRRTKPHRQKTVRLPFADVSRAIGVAIPPARIKKILQSLGFAVSLRSGALVARVPHYRALDIESGRDLVEEIARIYGYHNLPAVIPSGEIPVRPRDAEFVWEDHVREALHGAGYTEIVSYSLVSKLMLEHVGIPPTEPLCLANPLSADLLYLRTELLSSMLATIAENQGHVQSGALFEVAHVYLPRTTDLPDEVSRALAAVFGFGRELSRNGEGSSGDLFYAAKGFVEGFFSRHGIAGLGFESVAHSSHIFHPARQLAVMMGGERVGVIAEVHPRILRAFGVDHRVAVFDLDIRAFVSRMNTKRSYEPIPLYPPGKRDVSFVVDARTPYADIVRSLLGADPLLAAAELFDTYTGRGIPEGKKSMAFHLEYRLPVRTLTNEEVDAAHERVLHAMRKEFGATIRV